MQWEDNNKQQSISRCMFYELLFMSIEQIFDCLWVLSWSWATKQKELSCEREKPNFQWSWDTSRGTLERFGMARWRLNSFEHWVCHSDCTVVAVPITPHPVIQACMTSACTALRHLSRGRRLKSLRAPCAVLSDACHQATGERWRRKR